MTDSSKSEREKIYILTHICGIQKNDTDDLIGKREIETQMQRMNVQTPKEEG